MSALRKMYKFTQDKENAKIINLKRKLEDIDVKRKQENETIKANKNNDTAIKVGQK